MSMIKAGASWVIFAAVSASWVGCSAPTGDVGAATPGEGFTPAADPTAQDPEEDATPETSNETASPVPPAADAAPEVEVDAAAVDSGTADPPVKDGFPARVAAPYVAVWNDNDLAALSKSTGHHFWTLAFVINGGGKCNPMWNGDTALGGNNYGKYIDALQKTGGDVIVSFGGASGTEVALSCDSVASLQAAYQKVITQFHLSWIDLDIESGQESDAPSIDRRNKALHNLQVANPGLKVSYTLAVDRSGLPAAQRKLLANAKENGVDVTVVNIMAMDYGPCYSDMGQAAVDAAKATQAQLATIGLSSSVGVTPMIGTNDVSCEKFSAADAHVLVDWAQKNSFVRLLAYWVQDSDPSHTYSEVFKTFH